MKPEIKKQWVEALNNYQTKIETSNNPGRSVWHNKIKSGEYFSPDGILCDIYLKEHGIEWENDLCLGTNVTIPKQVKDWAGLDRHDPLLPSYKKEGAPIHGYSLMTLCLISAVGRVKSDNGISGYRDINYRDIAQLIEQDL